MSQLHLYARYSVEWARPQPAAALRFTSMQASQCTRTHTNAAMSGRSAHLRAAQVAVVVLGPLASQVHPSSNDQRDHERDRYPDWHVLVRFSVTLAPGLFAS